ncbi:EscU/YscU/HrcU family type III secretion system export apparatus switch protein [Roseivivax isoporae]|uniref:Flagellar biosynthesis protein FlhB n=1 Tax=Roseivivax isoporae LMG 25204 TaxID=1449351 RepID=X7FC65_9RHOB|nr:flagellar type III secretion system protein FlhB [Roseivivax isoporae]ETX29686.1 flagellar biosynthesis protein FlhB [Roseivivax isoporae LMG 25204]
MTDAAQDDTAEKPHDPTERRLQQARQRGEIARSPDLLTAAAYAGLLAALAFAGEHMARDLGSALLPFLDHPDMLARALFYDGASAPAGRLMTGITGSVLGLFLAPTGLVAGALLATRGVVFAPARLSPRLERIAPLANARNKYGRRGLFEFAKSFVKLVVYGGCLALLLGRQSDALLAGSGMSPPAVAAALGVGIVGFLSVVLPVAVVIACVDMLWQRADHLRRNRMSLKELRDEMKESEGDPHVRQQRRARAQEIALNAMVRAVPKADVVIVNPTHYAVALAWSRTPGSAPVCVARGRDHVALRIREVAMAAGVPVHSDPPTARALHASVRLGQEIPVEHYRAVAAAIRFADAMRAKARHSWS